MKHVKTVKEMFIKHWEAIVLGITRVEKVFSERETISFALLPLHAGLDIRKKPLKESIQRETDMAK